MPSGATPSDNLYITGLPPGIDDDTLRQIFEGYAPVAQCKILPSKQHEGKCAAFVRYHDVATAAAVADSINRGGIPLGLSEPVTAQFAEPKGSDGKGGGYGKAGGGFNAMQNRSSPYGSPKGGTDIPPCDNLYVTLLPPEIDNNILSQVFGQYGTVMQSKVLPSKMPGGKCAAFVRFATVEEAAAVVQNFHNGTILQDFAEPIALKFADENKMGAGKGCGGGGGKPALPPSDNLYVTLLPPEIDNNLLSQIFGQYGTVVQCKVLPSKIPGGKCAAFVRYSSVEESSAVVQNFQTGSILQDFAEPIAVKFADDNKFTGGFGCGGGGSGGWNSGGGDGGNWGSSGGTWNKGGGGGGGSWNSGGGSWSGKGSGQGEDAPPSANLYVSLLPSDMDNQSLEQIFGQYGTVTQCRVLPARGSGGKCAAFVRFQTVEEAVTIKDGLNGNIPQGLDEPIKVQFAEAPGTRNTGMAALPGQKGGGGGEKGGGGGGWNSGGGGWNDNSDWNSNPKGGQAASEDVTADLLVQAFEMSGRMPGGTKFSNDDNTLYICGLPPDTNDLHLFRIFSSFGPIAPKGVRSVKKPDGTCKGIGFVNYLAHDSAQAAIAAYNGAQLPDGTILKVAIKS